MNAATKKTYEPVDASPVKSFFVTMLTRDIKLEDAILDLLDNCVDGILRSKGNTKNNKPYKGFKAEISFNKDTFSISDNCGGIPWNLHKYAFKMGRANERPDNALGSVGVYGIGMKRAIFKMGRQCLISTQHKNDRYEVDITPKWIDDEKAWTIPVKAAKKNRTSDGTTIVVGDLYEGVKARFGEDAKAFAKELKNLVSTHYAFIIDKGFEVKINNEVVSPEPTKLIFAAAKDGIKPYIFKTEHDGVEVFLAVGFTRPIPSQEELDDEQEKKQYSSMDAGWTVICTDRAVLYCDRSELTGWGEAGVPRYHTQFIAISGIVEFRSKDPSKLPTTTTKRGIDASSPLYLQVKNKMREGMTIFTDYTNKWKGQADATKKHMAAGRPMSLEQIKEQKLQFSKTTKSVPAGSQYRPTLPMPKKIEAKQRRISYVKDIKDVNKLALYLFEDENASPSDVGEKCFDLMLKEAR